MDRSWRVPGGAPSLFVAGGASLLHPDEQVFEAMLADWRDQQLSRNLRAETVRARLLAVRRFQRFTNDWPWLWRPVDVEEFTAELRGEGRTLATIRAYHGSLRQFLDYVCDPRYEWPAVLADALGVRAKTAVNYAAASGADYLTYPNRRQA